MRSGENTTHLDTDVLAEFRAGLTTGRRGAKITAHLAGCDRCTALDDQLAGVSVLLASVPAPTMPDSVAQRLDAVLAAEVARKDHPERTEADRSRQSRAHDRPAAHRGFRLLSLRVLAPVAVVLLAAGGYGVSRIVGPGNPPTFGAAGSAASSASSAAASSDGAAKSAGRALAPEASPSSPAPSAASGSRRVSTAAMPVASSQANLSAATLKQHVQAALAVPPAGRTTQAASPVVKACVDRVAGGAPLLLVESAHFEGQPAIIVVARTGQDDTAWAVAGPSCSDANPHVLAQTTLPAGISGP